MEAKGSIDLSNFKNFKVYLNKNTVISSNLCIGVINRFTLNPIPIG